MDMEIYSFLELPEAAASFMMYVGFGVFDDMNNEALDAWIAGFDWENHSFAQPNYEVFTGFVGYFNEPKYDEGVFVAMYSDAFTSDNYYGIGASGFVDGEFTEAGTGYFPKSSAPADGDQIDWDNLGLTEYTAEGSYPDSYAGGINSEFGYDYNTWTEANDKDVYEFVFWHYNSGTPGEDYPQGDYSVLIIQEFDDASNIWFTSDVAIYNMSGATQLVAASIAAATSLYAMI